MNAAWQIVGEGRTYRIMRIGHRVEWPNGQREFVQNVEVGVVFGLHQTTEQFLIWCGEILFVAHFDAGLTQHCHTLRKFQFQWWLQELERLHVVLLTDGGDFASITTMEYK